VQQCCVICVTLFVKCAMIRLDWIQFCSTSQSDEEIRFVLASDILVKRVEVFILGPFVIYGVFLRKCFLVTVRLGT